MYGKLYHKNFEITLNAPQFDKKVKSKSAFFNFIEIFSNRQRQSTINVLRKYRVLNKLRNNRDILIMKLDKGNGVVVVDR